jgi:hypothetical protein
LSEQRIIPDFVATRTYPWSLGESAMTDGVGDVDVETTLDFVADVLGGGLVWEAQAMPPATTAPPITAPTTVVRMWAMFMVCSSSDVAGGSAALKGTSSQRCSADTFAITAGNSPPH